MKRFKEIRTQRVFGRGKVYKISLTDSFKDKVQILTTYTPKEKERLDLIADKFYDDPDSVVKNIIDECVKMVREKVGPVAAFKIAIVVKRLPKTRSGKVLRGTVRKIADNEPYKMPATIDDPAILDEIKADLVENKILKL